VNETRIVNHRLTIVTVVKDDDDGFRRTLNSVLAQDLVDVEFLVVDSSAQPRINQESLAKADIGYMYEWLVPEGIYPAMNSALERATGEYVYFLNAGDQFHDANAVATIKSLLSTQPEWCFGRVRFISPDGQFVTPKPIDYAREQSSQFARGLFPAHQGTIARRELLSSLGGFDTRYRIAADYALFLKLSLAARPLATDAVLADFYVGGLSSVAWRESIGEFHRARQSLLPMSRSERIRENFNTLCQLAMMSVARMRPGVRN
jgi:glycosyltransferase involved in cell wall biosynthesis